MELGPLQKYWIETLRKHPERQLRHQLGKKSMGYCCLGQLHICYYEQKHEKPPFDNDNNLTDGNETELAISYNKYGLVDEQGRLKTHFAKDNIVYNSLAKMNDHGFSWPEIADYVEKYPENIFTKSV